MRRVALALTAQQVAVEIARLHWRGHTMTDWLEELAQTLDDWYLANTTIIGFGYGAMLATMVASRQTPQQVVLCNLPNSWAEDLTNLTLNWWHRSVHSDLWQDFKAYRFSEIAQTITSPTTIVLGEAESLRMPGLLARAQIAQHLIAGSQLQIVPGSSRNFFRSLNQESLHQLLPLSGT